MNEMKEAQVNRRRFGFVAVIARVCYAFAAAVFTGCVILQVYFAGLAVLVDPKYWSAHIAFARVISWVALSLLGFALLARLPRRTLGLTVLVVALFALQFLLISLPSRLGVMALRGLHPVNALAIFWLAIHLARRARPLLRTPSPHADLPMQARTVRTPHSVR